jgi:hypothetical protein
MHTLCNALLPREHWRDRANEEKQGIEKER